MANQTVPFSSGMQIYLHCNQSAKTSEVDTFTMDKILQKLGLELFYFSRTYLPVIHYQLFNQMKEQ